MPPRPAPMIKTDGWSCISLSSLVQHSKRRTAFIEKAQNALGRAIFEESAEQAADARAMPRHRPQHQRLVKPVAPGRGGHIERVPLRQQRTHYRRRVAL